MRIAFIVGEFPALSETFVLNQITGLIDRGHEVDIFASKRWKGDKVHPEVERYGLQFRTYYWQAPMNKIWRVIKGVVLILLNFHKAPLVVLRSLNFLKHGKIALSLKLFYSVIPFLDKESYDIIHCHFGPNGILGIRLKELGIQGKYITSFHGYDANSYVQKHGKEIYRDLFGKVDLCTVNTDFIGKRVKTIGCDPSKIVKLPVGIDVTKFPFKERRIDPRNKINIITIARLVEVKGIEYSIRAVGRVINEHPNVYYQIVGDGPLRDQLESLIDRLGLQKNIRLLGWMNGSEVLRLYNESHIFILSSVTDSEGNQEGQGLALVEAQAMGLPVVSTFVGGIPEVVLDGKSGFLVPERDVEALTKTLDHLVRHPELWPEMGRAGREFVERHYNIAELNDRLVELYEELFN